MVVGRSPGWRLHQQQPAVASGDLIRDWFASTDLKIECLSGSWRGLIIAMPGRASHSRSKLY